MKCIIMAAGEGVRMKPLTNTRPKVMLQVAGKPILHHLLLELKKAGITEAVIVIRYMKEQIIDYFKQNDIGMKINFIEQGTKNGTAEAILTAEKFMNDTFVAIAGDIITEAGAIKKVIDNHKGTITLAIKKVEHPHLYGVVELNKNGTIALFQEKAEKPKSNLANLSIYCMEPTIFQEIRSIPKSERGEYEIVNLFIGAKAIVVDDFWMDVGYPWHLFDANEFLLNKMNAKNETIENSTINGKVIMEKGAKIINSHVEGVAYIGENTVIGPGAYLKGYTSIGKNCSIGGGTTIKNSILYDNVNAKHLSYIGDSIVGSNVNFGSNSQVANYRFDESYVNVLTERGWTNTGRKKMGCIVGDNTKFGVLSCVMPGKLIGNDCWISSGVIVGQNIESETHVFIKQELRFSKQKKED
ncbi:MAG: sugar phosphate nucleotidyltransferase [Candidatus Micrarchaeota archaeon]|nr:sugar phosphate nucleotidyltransferase [Candidatus Micrarchaeota archaeon]